MSSYAGFKKETAVMRHRSHCLPAAFFVALAAVTAFSAAAAAGEQREAVRRYVRCQAKDRAFYGVVEDNRVRNFAGRFAHWEPTERTQALSETRS